MSFTRYSKSINNINGNLSPTHAQDFNMGVGGESAGLIRQAGKQFYDTKDDSLVGAWLMDEGKGLFLRDHSIYGNHGTITGADWVADGLDFDGSSNDKIDCGSDDVLNITTNISIHLWLKIDNLSAEQMIISREATGWAGWQIVFDRGANNSLQYMRSGGFHTSNANAISDSNWHHVAVVSKPPDSVSFYVDGASVGVDSTTFSVVDNPGVSLWIGLDSSNLRDLDGTIHSTFIYNRALTAEEISNIYNADHYRFQENLEYSI